MSDVKKPRNDIGGEVWSEILSAIRYPAEDEYRFIQFAKEESRASVAANRILRTIREALTSYGIGSVPEGCERYACAGPVY